MALQIRRGTDADRQGITPKAGEPIFVTDTNKLYVGDGSTSGGVAIDTTAGLSNVIEDTSPQLGGNLDLNSKNITGTGNISITGSISATQFDISGSIFADDSTLLVDGVNGRIVGPVFANVTGDTNGTHTGAVVGNVTGNANGIHTGSFSGSITATGTLDGNFVGTVFGDDSTLLVDGVANMITGMVDNEQCVSQRFICTNNTAIESPVLVTTVTPGSNGPNLSFNAARTSITTPAAVQAGDSCIDIVGSGYDGTQYSAASLIKLGPDKYSTISNGVVPGRILFLTSDTSGAITAANAMVFNRLGNLGIKKDDPAQALDVNGNAIVSGTVTAASFNGSLTQDDSTTIIDGISGTITAPSTVQFGSFTTTQRNALTAVNGMIIYNTTDNKFQGYENGGWANLI